MKVTIRSGSVGISGYVNAVGRESRPLKDEDGYFIETIEPGAFARALRRKGTRQMLLNHDEGRVLSEEGSGLTLFEDNVGLYAEADVTDQEVIDKAKARKLRGWSFGFRPIAQEYTEKDGMRHRLVRDLELFEVSLLDDRKTPAYQATSVFTRADDDEGYEVRFMEFQDADTDERACGDDEPCRGCGKQPEREDGPMDDGQDQAPEHDPDGASAIDEVEQVEEVKVVNLSMYTARIKALKAVRH